MRKLGRNRRIAIALFLAIGAVFLIPLGLGWISNVSNVVEQFVAGTMVALALAGGILWWKGGRDDMNEKNIPQIEFRGEYFAPDSINPEGRFTPVTTYFLRIDKVGGNGFAKNCEASITVHDSDIIARPTVWRNDLQYADISSTSYMKLFSLHIESNQLFLYSSRVPRGFTLDGRDIFFVEKEIEVKIAAESGKVLSKPYIKKISSIMREAEMSQNKLSEI